MKLKRPTRRRPSESIIALIDVVFFLLVFFMLVGRMDATAPFEVEPAMALTGSDMPGGGTTLSVSETGTFALDGTPLGEEQVLGALADLLAGDPALLVRVNAHRNAQLRHVLPVVARIEALGAQDVMLVVTPEPL